METPQLNKNTFLLEAVYDRADGIDVCYPRFASPTLHSISLFIEHNSDDLYKYSINIYRHKQISYTV